MDTSRYIIEGGGAPSLTVDFATLRDFYNRGDLNLLTVRSFETGQILSIDQVKQLVQPSAAPPISAPMGQWTQPPTMSDIRAAMPREKVDGNQDPMRFVAPIHTSGWAVTASYLGLLSVLLVFAPFAIITGILALRDLQANPTKTGKGRAIFGLVMGGVCLLFYGILFVVNMAYRPS